jgi:hypothetical protein
LIAAAQNVENIEKNQVAVFVFQQRQNRFYDCELLGAADEK